ncbi:chemotaxis response regulator protein-glutamate methylesterase [Paenibacillus alkaliterrae]|uniref:protein-glutamate methylesterase/protein-glutamine glutaminase n=1 Tax=Paenibacillus alkaliterrae TaxID=320909 RepID=UPI001F3DA009|nr:chemotaxis response regulator protein-glutamate methylesterase [Paenibacillus alkaliterrae]MCF2937026.1 chemotaxis response regulator protein-glutamate methylesterase [Paenibacillus alkaliterrae]
MAPYRVLVVDDSAFMRKIISDLIVQDPQFTIVATAGNGQEAIEAIHVWKPDAVTLDLEMPLMNGIEALQQIMQFNPIPVIMLSGISEDNTRETIKALQFGAFDFIRKPSSTLSNDIHQVGEVLLEKLRIAVKVRLEPNLSVNRDNQPIKPTAAPLHTTSVDYKSEQAATSKVKSTYVPRKPTVKDVQADSSATAVEPAVPHKPKGIGQRTAFRHIVAMGTSTGGPRALHEVITSLPEDFPAPVLVVQHMPPKFTKSLAQRLDSFSELKVVEAEQGAKVSAGVVYIAPGGYHMELMKDSSGYSILLTEQPQRNGHRPSVDVLFESLTTFRELKRHAVIMTGMGSDGAKGMKLLVESGVDSTIAEAEETCVVYGMPRSAIEAGHVNTILPLQHIASHLIHAMLK